MNSHNKYLTKKNPEAENSIQKIKWLLESSNERDVELAFSLIKGGGLSQDLTTYLLAISFFHQEEKVRTKARSIYKKYANEDLYNHTKKKWRYNYRYSFDETKMSDFLSEINTHPQINGLELSNLALKFIHKGGKYCLENNTAPKEYILRILCRKDRLSLAYFDLEEMPTEIGKLTNLVALHIGGNRFSEVPDELQNLKKLTQFYYKNTPLSAKAIKKLEKFFPHIFAQQLLRDVQRSLQQHKHYTKAMELMDKICGLTPEDTYVWTVKGQLLTRMKKYEEALASLKQAIELSPNNVQAWVQRVFTLRRKGNLQEALKINNQAIQLLKKKTSPLMLSYLYEQQGRVLCQLHDYQNALNSFQKVIIEQPEEVKFYYDIAKLAAKLQNKELLMNSIRQLVSLKVDWRDKILSNSLFSNYYEEIRQIV